MSIFSTMLELQLSSLKSILFYPEDQKMFLSGFLCSIEQMRKRSIFWQKPWTNPFAKCRYFFTSLELHFSGLKSIFFYQEYKKMFLSGFFCSKKKHMKKGRYFDKNHGLTPLQTVHFFYFGRDSLFRFKQDSFLSRISKNVSLWLFLLKRNIWDKGRFFDKNHGPFAKCRFFSVFCNFSFVV